MFNVVAVLTKDPVKIEDGQDDYYFSCEICDMKFTKREVGGFILL